MKILFGHTLRLEFQTRDAVAVVQRIVVRAVIDVQNDVQHDAVVTQVALVTVTGPVRRAQVNFYIAARRTVVDKFDVGANVARLAEIFQQLTESRRTAL